MILCRPTMRIAIAAWLVLHVLGVGAAGQPPTHEPPRVSGPIEYVGPDTFILLDSQGRPQPVLGMSYEEFVAAWKKREQLEAGDTEPRFTIDQLQISGDTRDDYVELSVDITIRSLAGGPLKVPLGMADAILLEEPRIERPGAEQPTAAGKSFVGYEPQAGGFVAWIDGPPQQQSKLTLRVARPLVRDGASSSLPLNLPRATLSRLSLNVPTPIVDASVSGDGLLAREKTANGGTRLRVEGPSGDFRVSWSNSAADRPELATVLSATGVIAISIDGHSIRSEARLTVRSYGGSFDRFRVRLPPGARLIEDSAPEPGATLPNYRIVPDEPSATAAGSQIVSVELSEKQLGPVEIKLATEQPLGVADGGEEMELAGFEVLGALRQFGDVAIIVAEDWQLRWQGGPDVRQVDRAELPSSIRELQPTIALQYDLQPWSLRAQLDARPMVVHATPGYQLELGAEEARLRVELEYQVPGARAFEFRVRLAGWELTPDPIESNGLVDRDRLVVTRDGELVLPLAQASSRRAQIAFQLRRDIARSASQLRLPLPVPEADTVAAADLVVAADAAIELLPDVAASRGLSPTPVVGELPHDAARSGDRFFQYRVFVPDAIFVAQRSIRPSEVSVKIDTRLATEWRRLQATQEIEYNVQYQPLDEVALELPDGWSIADQQLEIVPTLSAAEPIAVAAITKPASVAGAKRIARAKLAQPRLGTFLVRASYKVAGPAWLDAIDERQIDLPRPEGAQVVEHRVEVASPPSMSVALDPTANSAWKAVDGPRAQAQWVAATPAAAAGFPLVITATPPAPPQATTVERIWLQSWWAGSTIQDRAAIRFRTDGRDVTVELPPLATERELEVLLDGAPAPASLHQNGRLTISLSDAEAESHDDEPAHTLELRYRRPAPIGLLTRHTLTPPQLVGSATLSEAYWQIVLPGERHVVSMPRQLIAVDPRQWFAIFTGYRAGKSQADLESWAGATTQLGPSAAQNSYLFSGLAPTSSIELLTAPRWMIVLLASGVLLALVIVWMYVPVVRRGWIALVLAVCVAGMSLAFPEPALLLGQASLVGVVLAAVALELRRWLAPEPMRRVPPATSTSTNIRLRSSLRSDSFVVTSPAPAGGASSTTPLAAPEVNS